MKNENLKMHNGDAALPANRAGFHRHFAFCILSFSFFVAVSCPCRADDAITFPLQGYYHPGRYMPVHVKVAPQFTSDLSVRLCSPGAVSTYVRFEGGRVDAIVPWMPVDARAKALSWAPYPRMIWTEAPTPLKPLGDHQRLIGYAGMSADEAMGIATLIFPGDELIPMPLNPSQPLPGSPASWDTLDAAVLDGAASGRIGETSLAALVAQGVAFAVRAGAAAPAQWSHWPWKQVEGTWQVLRFQPSGPPAATYSEAPYGPVSSSLRSGFSTAILRQVVLFAACFSLLILLLALWRPRGTVLGAIVLAGLAVVVLHYWTEVQKPVQTSGGKIRIVAAGITQDDDWTYQITHQRSVSFIRWIDISRVMCASAAQLDECGPRIDCYANGDPDFIYYVVPAETKVAVLSRRCGPQAPTITPSPTITSPLAPLVKELYLGPGGRVVGEFPSAPMMNVQYNPMRLWPAIIVERGDAPPGKSHSR